MNTHKWHIVLSVIFVTLIVTVMAGCLSWKRAVYHRYYMKGQILEANDKQAYLCIGSEEGARVGQEFNVYRHVRTGNPDFSWAGPTTQYAKEKTGRIKITRIHLGHYSYADILEGNIRRYDLAEFEPK